MTALRMLSRLLTRIETAVLVALLGGMIVLAFAQVLTRNLFGTGFVWGDTLVRYLVLWVGFVGAALATTEEKHISIDALTRFFSARGQALVKTVTNLFTGITCAYLTVSSWEFLQMERETGGEVFLSVPSWVALLIIPAGYLLLSIHFLLVAAEKGARVVGGREHVSS